MEKCYGCPQLRVTIGERAVFACGKSPRVPLTVPFLLTKLWEKGKDESKEVDCAGIQETRIEPIRSEEESEAIRSEGSVIVNHPEFGPKEYPINYGDERGYCPRCGTGHMVETGRYEPFKHTLYEYPRCDRCGYEEGELISRIPRR